MAKYFLGSVGTAEAFRMNNAQLELAFVSKTLTDSGLTISTTKDDVRAGTGGPIQFSFYHIAFFFLYVNDHSTFYAFFWLKLHIRPDSIIHKVKDAFF